ncbi:hypothetical protein F4823DRAFT_261215 [Ustulina deusta]|nr:hypothetical protein F4823DRAFT_261215 [Ustulina deusta]
MSIALQDLSDELVTRIAKVLARRPEYGIATPSRRWLQRQEEKMKNLPKELLRPSSLKRLAIKIVDRIDPNIVDPQAVLCKTHSALNPFLIRRLFIALAYEVTVHTDPLRSWRARSLDPELSALVGRLDSIVALWTVPQLFHEIYGLAPFDGHHVFVKSGCEACCLAAVGASGRALADLRAVLVDRTERRQGDSNPSGKEPRLYRVVEAWIDQLRKHSGDVDRPEQCRALSEALLVDLRMARPQIQAWRAEQRQHHAKLRAAKHPIYAELRRTRTGAEIAPLSPNAGHKRRTRNGIPVALVDIDGAEGQRRAAMSTHRSESIYRPDSLSGYSTVNERQRASYNPIPSTGPRPLAPEPVRMSGPSDGSPTQSFLDRFEQEMSTHHGHDPSVDSEEENELDENHYVEESRARVQEWWANQVSHSQLGVSQEDDAKSILSMVHPAFRPGSSHIAVSALPPSLHIRKDREPRANQPQGRRDTAPSVWTDCTAYTADPSSIQPDTTNVPPVPRIPSEYRCNERSSPGGDRTPQVASHAPPNRTEESSIAQSRQPSTTGFPKYEDPFMNRETPRESITRPSSKTKSKNPRPNWPAPPHGRHPPSALDNPRHQKLFLPESDVGSTFSEQRHAFLTERFKPREEDSQERNSLLTHLGTLTSTPTPDLPTPRPVSRTSSSVYSRGSGTSGSSAAPSHDSSHGSIASSELEGEWRASRRPSSEIDLVRPDDSASNSRWARHHDPPPSVNASSVTQLNAFQGKM